MLSEPDLKYLLEHRQGSHSDAPYGGVFAKGTHPPVPAVRPREGRTGGLTLPDPACLDRPLGQALLNRSTVRTRGTLTAGAVSTLLGHTLRIIDVRPGPVYDAVFKFVPSGGAMHPCEGYLFAVEVEGVPPGVWRYAAQDHALDRVAPMDARAYRIVEDAARSMGTEDHPPAVLVLAARWGRTAHKYSRIPLAAVLKDVGAIYSVASLVGFQCGAGVCPLGGGDLESFAEITGLDPMVEASVGEIALWGA